jgi:hypothetical protein
METAKPRKLNYESARRGSNRRLSRRIRSVLVGGLLALAIVALVFGATWWLVEHPTGGLSPKEIESQFGKIQDELGLNGRVVGLGRRGSLETYNDGYSCWLFLSLSPKEIAKLMGDIERLPLPIDRQAAVVAQPSDSKNQSEASQPDWWPGATSGVTWRRTVQFRVGERNVPIVEYWFAVDQSASMVYVRRSKR